MKPVNTIQMNPIARCNGRNATARFNSVLVAPPDSNMDVGSQGISDAAWGAKTEIITRAITVGGNIVSRDIEGNEP